ncbi:MAG TPA: hypothetical protein VJ204_09150 [Solirubrobacterales bacterium]|nr:hypothetical protein [Solirubrobacterales bacterium]
MSFLRSLQVALATALVVFACVAGSAAAAQGVVAPGHSGNSQYTETLPTAGGETPTEGVGHNAAGAPAGGGGGDSSGGGEEAAAVTGGSPSPAEALGSENAKRLEKAGPAGKAAAQLAATTSGSPAGKGATSDGPEGDGSSPVGQIVGQVTGTSSSQGIGLLLPILIAMAAIFAVGFVIVRRRPVHPGD